jgi:hypothetical protein
MRLHRCMPALVAAVTLAGVSAPAANATDAIAPGSGGPEPTQVVQHHSAASTDWVIAIGTGTGIALLGTGAAATRRNRRLRGAHSAKTQVVS